MDSIYVLYDFDLKLAYDVDLYSEQAIIDENAELQARGESVRWIPIAEFRAIRSRCVVCIIAKEGEYVTSRPVSFVDAEEAEETARRLGGVVKEMMIF